MPNELLLALIFTLSYCMLFIDSRIYNDVYIKIMKIDVVFTLVSSSWAALFFNSILDMNFYLILAFVALLLLGIQSLLYHYRVKKRMDTVENRFTDVDSVFRNKVGTIETRVNGNYYLGTIVLDEKEQQIMVYSDKMLVNADKFVIVAFEGSKIIVEKLSGTEVVNNNDENNNEEKNAE